MITPYTKLVKLSTVVEVYQDPNEITDSIIRSIQAADLRNTVPRGRGLLGHDTWYLPDFTFDQYPERGELCR